MKKEGHFTYSPKGYVSRKEIAEYFKTSKRQVARWEEYRLLPKGERKEGYGLDCYYAKKAFLALTKKIKRSEEK
jgi:hypothetical protein